MGNQSKYSKVQDLTGMTEVFTIIYDRNLVSFDEFLFLENIAIGTAVMLKWKVFTAFPVKELGPLMVCKN
jgi:hypothetical protein